MERASEDSLNDPNLDNGSLIIEENYLWAMIKKFLIS